MRQEAKGAEPVVDRHDDDVFGDETPRIVPVTLTEEETTSVDPYHHGQEMREPLVRLRRREHVEIKTVLGQAGDPVRAGILWAVVRKSRQIGRASGRERVLDSGAR